MRTNMPFHPQKCFTPTLEGNTKRVLVGIIALSSLKSLSQYFLVTEGGIAALQNISIEKEKKRKKEKKDKCPRKKEE